MGEQTSAPPPLSPFPVSQGPAFVQWLRGSGGEARGSAATGVGPTGGFGRVGSVGSASHPALKYKGAWQCLVGRASFGQARASAPPPAFPHLRAKGRLSLLLPTRPPGAEVRNRAQRSSSGCGWALVQMAVGPMHASKTCNAKRSRTRWRSRRAPPPLSPLSHPVLVFYRRPDSARPAAESP